MAECRCEPVDDAAMDPAGFTNTVKNRDEHGLDLLENEFGTELRSAEAVRTLLDRVREESCELEEQVRGPPPFPPPPPPLSPGLFSAEEQPR